MWDFPMCLGAIDGKHVVIQAPAGAGSEFFNYKGSHSIVLLAVCDAQYCFTMIDIGDLGRHSDGGVFANSEFGKRFMSGDLNVPSQACLPNTSVCVPYCIVGDAAFPLRQNLMRPYPGKNLPADKSIFNYRLSRARRVIENTFGILATRWRIFRRPIIAKPERVVAFTKAACCLHIFLQIKSRQNVRNAYCYIFIC
uniref:Putative nuclease HARBI1 n=1 Tax=Phallusia mammillata TaxID=59560 RepID=A0A6F9DEU1_9ASCI|nr:putative nuclease HARBI1 [Phallusia mammillata]